MTREIGVALFFFITSIAFTWPLGNLAHPQLPFPHDAMFSTWRLAWVAHQVPRDPAHLFDANIFWPEPNTLAFSDAMLLLGLIATPLIRVGVHPAAVHNVLLIAGFVGAGYGAWRLLYKLTSHAPAALVGGMIFAFAPYRFGHIGHLELLWTAFMPLAVLALYRVLDAPSPRRGVGLGALLGLQALCSLYYFVFLAIWLVPVALLARLHLVVRPSRKHVIALTAGVLTTVVLVSPYFAPYLRAHAELGARPTEEVQRYSATLTDYLRVSWGNWLYGAQWAESYEERSLFPGALVMGLTAVALIRVRSRLVLAFAVAGMVAIDLSLGPNGVLYRVLRVLLPPLSGIRAPARFGVLVLLAFSVLSAISVAHLLRHRSHRQQQLATIALLGVLTIEYWSGPMTTRETPLAPLRVHQWLLEQPPGPVIEFPVPVPESLWRHEPDYEYLSIYHWQPIINGYSGYAPASYVRLLEDLRDFPSDRSVQHLVARGARVALMHERYMSPDEFNMLLVACENRRWFRSMVVFDVAAGKGRTAACTLLAPAH